MDFKQAIIENAWGGFSVDYGLLHLQLATPFAVMIVLFIMIYALNKLLFQPVLRTLDNRSDAIAKSQQSVIQVTEEVESLKQEFEKKTGCSSCKCWPAKRIWCCICWKLDYIS